VDDVTTTRARRVALVALTGEVLVLAVTGAVLYFAYVPTATQAFGPGFPEAEGGELAQAFRFVHRWVAWLAVATSVIAAALLAIRSQPAEHMGRARVRGALLAVAMVVATFTGFLLPWDQIALSVVTVGGNLSGYTWLRDDEILFLLVDNHEIAASTLLQWLVLHTVVLGGAVVALLGVAWRSGRHTPAPSAETAALPRDAPVAP
jgi:quinol-cytochrome oxidoreductase complex cytochrome b subunit